VKKLILQKPSPYRWKDMKWRIIVGVGIVILIIVIVVPIVKA